MVDGDQLIGWRYLVNSNVDPYPEVDATVTANSQLLNVGDWRHRGLAGRERSSRRPGGLVRVSADRRRDLDGERVRMLNVATSA